MTKDKDKEPVTRRGVTALEIVCGDGTIIPKGTPVRDDGVTEEFFCGEFGYTSLDESEVEWD